MSNLAVPGATLYYESQGNGPLMVIVPASSGALDSYRLLAEQFTADYTVARYDRRGFSRSYLVDPQDYERRIETDADDVRRLIEHLGGATAIVVGSSSGALVTLAVLTEHPDVVAKAVAYEPPAMTAWSGGQEWIDRFHSMYELYHRVGPRPAVTQFQEAAFAPSDLATMAAVADPAKDPYVVGNGTYWFGVAVGTALTGGPPHRSQRAGLPHWAPASGDERRSVVPGRGAARGVSAATVRRGASYAPRSYWCAGCGVEVLGASGV